MLAVLINPYELGRQSFALAQPAAWLRASGIETQTLDLALERLDPEQLARARLIALHLGMHTATRIAVEVLPRLRTLAPRAHLAAYGLYAPVNEVLLRELGVRTVLGGEPEPALTALAVRLRDGGADSEPGKLRFRVPDRTGMPALARYARLQLPDGETRTVGFADSTRGCKHLCRHCPVVPVYGGRFRAVPREVVLADIRQQVAAGARHISFGDPDFLNGPRHAERLVDAMHAEFPALTWDATIKVEHLLARRRMLPGFARRGCLFITSAVESLDDDVLRLLEKGHTAADFESALALLRRAGIAMAPTFIPFTPWTTLEGYLALLEKLVTLRLVHSVQPVQLTIRLLVPQGSRLLEVPEVPDLLEGFDAQTLGYPWRHRDPRVDRLQQSVQAWVEESEQCGLSRREVFEGIRQRAHAALEREAPGLPDELGQDVPRLSENWYCCAEPTSAQLAVV